jgi:hypothetical protein
MGASLWPPNIKAALRGFPSWLFAGAVNRGASTSAKRVSHLPDNGSKALRLKGESGIPL